MAGLLSLEYITKPGWRPWRWENPPVSSFTKGDTGGFGLRRLSKLLKDQKDIAQRTHCMFFGGFALPVENCSLKDRFLLKQVLFDLRTEERGVSLIETLAAIMIVATVVTGSIGVLGAATRASGGVETGARLLQVARQPNRDHPAVPFPEQPRRLSGHHRPARRRQRKHLGH